MSMKTAKRLTVLLLILSADSYGQTISVRTDRFPSTPALGNRLARFEVTDATLADALSKLSFEPITGLHLGIEEIIRTRDSELSDRSVRFSLNLHDVSVRDIVTTLCKFDSRYTWSTDGTSIDVYPREIVGDSSYLLNRALDSIALKNINGPADALTPLMKLVPGEQLGVAGIGLNNDYAEPWSMVFSHLTVRQLMNRLSEHYGPSGGWIWSGSKGQRFFAYFDHGFKRW